MCSHLALKLVSEAARGIWLRNKIPFWVRKHDCGFDFWALNWYQKKTQKNKGKKSLLIRQLSLFSSEMVNCLLFLLSPQLEIMEQEQGSHWPLSLCIFLVKCLDVENSSALQPLSNFFFLCTVSVTRDAQCW